MTTSLVFMMERKMVQAMATFLLSLFILIGIQYCYCLPLSTNGRWIVDAKTGQRVKLTCVSWPSHLEPMLAEGLDKKPLRYIVSQLHYKQHYFNCVRFTWATYMFTRYANRTVQESLNSLNLTNAKAGIAKYNPSILSMTLVQAFEAVVNEFGAQNVMVVLDNQLSRPLWCCTSDDGNGFIGDADFDANEWLQGLAIVAVRFKGKSQVIAISTRNELRGPHENEYDWYKYINEAGSTIHKANPDVLIFASGLGFASDLTFLKKKSLGTNFDNKLVYESHWYSNSWGWANTWGMENVTKVCSENTEFFIHQTGFVINGENPVPMFVGEIGLDQRGLSQTEEHYYSCILAYLADVDMDWAWWAWPGSYYYLDTAQNKFEVDDVMGVMDFRVNRVRNPQFQSRLQLIKRKLQEPNSKSSASYIMFHPQSGSCMHTDDGKEIYATSCEAPNRWIHSGDGSPIQLRGTNLCLKVVRDGAEPILSTDCSSQQCLWSEIDHLHLAASLDEKGELVCLHKQSPYTSKILTSKCIFTQEDPACRKDPQKDPTSQWFKLVKSNNVL